MDPRNYKIEGATLNWVKVAKPQQNPFNKEEYQYEMQIATTDAAKAEEWKANHLNVKTKDGVHTVSLRRKAKRADGSDNGPVRVVDANLAPFENVSTIGNGSVGNVIVFQYPWNNMGRSGISSSLTAIQVIEYKEYKPENNLGFEVVPGAAEPAESQDPVSMF